MFKVVENTENLDAPILIFAEYFCYFGANHVTYSLHLQFYFESNDAPMHKSNVCLELQQAITKLINSFLNRKYIRLTASTKPLNTSHILQAHDCLIPFTCDTSTFKLYCFNYPSVIMPHSLLDYRFLLKMFSLNKNSINDTSFNTRHFNIGPPWVNHSHD